MGICASVQNCINKQDESTTFMTNKTKTKSKVMKNGSVYDNRNPNKKNIQFIFNSDVSIKNYTENFNIENKTIKADIIDFIITSLKDNFVFFSLRDSEFEEIITNMVFGKVNKDEYVFKQNNQSYCFFVIDSGTFDVEIDGIKKKSIRRGSCFGELGLLYNAPRSASLKATEDSYVWAIERKIFKKLIQRLNMSEYEENKSFLEKNSIFEGLTEFQKENLASNIITQKFKPGFNIVDKNEKADSYYIIKTGIVECYDADKLVRELQEGDSFGEQALYEDGIRSLTVKAKTEVRCLAISREILFSVFSEGIENVIFKNNLIWTLSNDRIFKKLSKLQIQKWVNYSIIEKTKSEDSVILENSKEPLDHIYIVLDGYLTYGKQLVKKGEIFGKCLFEKSEFENISLDYDLLVSCATYSKIQIKILSKLLKTPKLFDAIKKNEHLEEKRKTLMGATSYDDPNDIDFDDLVYVKKLGEGQFGIVSLVINTKAPKKIFALKSVSRSKIAQFGIENHIINEKTVLNEIDHKFIIKLIKTFKDDKSIHFLMTFVNGIEMFELIRQVDLLENSECQFYIASLILCLEHLHGKNVVYRDLKPENIMVDEHGYINLIDMGTAKKLNKNRTFTIIGTPHYMAPEIIQSKGYGTMIDLWSLGVCMFEFMCGFVPFGEDEDDPFNVYKIVINGQLKFPPYFINSNNSEAKSFITLLLNKVPETRLNDSYTGLKAHKWFEDFDWVN